MKINKKNIIKILDSIYDNALEGLPGASPVKDEAEKYLSNHNNNKEKAIESVIQWAIAKNASSGFLSSLGGIITLPVAVPCGLAASFYIQMRMVAIIAKISGYNPSEEQVKTLTYACLIGDACMDIFKKMGVKIGEKLTHKVITSISGKTLIEINRLVGFRLVTKFGEKGIINLGKGIPFVGGVIGASVDGLSCRSSGRIAKKIFFKHENQSE